METALIATRPGRPAVLVAHGGRIYVAVHDEYYRRTLREFKRRLKLAHPDLHRGTQPVAGATVTKRLVTRDGIDRGLITYVVAPHSQRRPTPKQATRFRAVQRAMTHWKHREAQWYAAHGLTPPEWGD